MAIYFKSVGVLYIFTFSFYTNQKRLLMKLKLTLLCIDIICCCFLQQVIAQTISVSGKVKNKVTGEPLISASVSVQGTTSSVITDAGGKFTISAQKGSTLIIVFGLPPISHQDDAVRAIFCAYSIKE